MSSKRASRRLAAPLAGDRSADGAALPAKPKRWRLKPKPPRTQANIVVAPYRKPATAGPGRLMFFILIAVLFFFYGAGFALLAPSRIVLFMIPPAIFALLAIWALPTNDKAPIGLIEPLFLAFFASLFLWPNYLAIALPGLPWMTLLRLTGIPLALVVLMCVSMSPAFRQTLRETTRADPLIWRTYLLFIALQVFSLAMSAQPAFSINRFVVAQTNWTSILVVACFLFRERGFAERWAAMLLTMGYVLCIFGVWEFARQHVLWAQHVPSIIKIQDPAVVRTLGGMARAATMKYRITGTATLPLGLAEFIAATSPFALHFALERYSVITRVLGLVYLPLAIAVILMTDSRLGLVGSIIALLFYLAVWAGLKWKRDRGGIVGPAIVMAYPVIFCAVIAATMFVGRLRVMVWGGGAQSASTEGRRVQWQMAIPKIFDRPLGHGTGTSASVLGFIAPGSDTLTIDSYFIAILLDYGILGFIVYYGLFARTAWLGAVTAVRAPRERELRLVMPMAVSLIAFLVVKSVFSQEDNHPLYFMMIGGILALSSRAQAAAATTPESPR